MRKADSAVLFFAVVVLVAVFALNSCTYNYSYPEREKVVYVDKIVTDKKLEAKVKKLKKTLRFRTYQRDSLQCKLDSFIYSIIKNQ